MSKNLIKLFEEILNSSKRIREMSAVGELKGPKIGHYYLEVFSREYKDETPHVTLEIPQGSRKLLVAKIELSENQPSEKDEPNFIWIRKNFTIFNSLKKEIMKWLATSDEDGLTGWRNARKYWDSQAKSISWGQLKK
jgi:hypothetical protein